MNDVLFCGLANLNILSGGGLGESVLILFACYPGSGRMQSEPESSELEVSTIAGDRAEDLDSGKGEGGPREGSEDAGPGEGTIAAEPMELIDNAGLWDMDIGQPDAIGDDLLYDLVEGVLTLCSSTGSDLKLHLIDGVRVLMVSSSLRLWTERRGNSLTPIGRPLFL